MIEEKDFCFFYCGEDRRRPYGQRFFKSLYKKLIGANQEVYDAEENGQGDAYSNFYELVELVSHIRNSVIIYISPTYMERIAADLPKIDKDKLIEEYAALRNGKISSEEHSELDKIQNLSDVLLKELFAVLLEAKFKYEESNQISKFIHYVHDRNFSWDNTQKKNVRDFIDLGFALSEYFDLSAFQSNKIGFDAWDNEAQSDRFIEDEVSRFIVEHCRLDITYEQFKIRCERDKYIAFHTILQHAQHVYFDKLAVDLCQGKKIDYLTATVPKHFVDMLMPLEIERARATCWPVWFDDLGQSDDMNKLRALENCEYIKTGSTVNSCSVCFGALRLSTWYNQNKDKANLPKLTELYIQQCIEGARNMILLLRDEKSRLWKEQVVFGNNTDYNVNCLNDTTLCLSTLMVTGFLKTDATDKSKYELYRKRYSYIAESIDALIDKGDKSTQGISWSWAEGNVQPFSTLMTALCLDVLVKFVDICYANMAIYSVIDGYFDRIERINLCIKDILAFFDTAQSSNGAFAPCKAELTQNSVSHTAKIGNSLCTLADSKQIELSYNTKVIISKAFDYVLSRLGLNISASRACSNTDTLFNPMYHEEFNIPGSYARGPEYEMCGELMTVTFLLKIIKEPGKYLVGDALSYCVVHDDVIASMLVEIIYRFEKERLTRYVDITGADAFVVKSKVGEDKYPIYLLYYYDIAVTDMFHYLKEGKA